MGSIEEISQLCRLCLIKDQVNVPIFDETSDINETFVKINSCLPVKVSPDDNLPKKICDGCSYKLDMLYIFRNTSAESEQQLVAWLDEAGLASCGLPQTSIKESNTKSEILVKQEAFEATDPRVEDDTSDAHSYILQQQKLPYQQEFTFVEATASGSGLVSDEPPLKRPKRAAALKKISVESEDLEATMQITKAEDDDSDDADQPDYIEAPSTSADDQPGPSGVEKGTIDAPLQDNASDTSEETITIDVIDDSNTMDDVHAIETKKRKRIVCHECGNLVTLNYLATHMYEMHYYKPDIASPSVLCAHCGVLCKDNRTYWLHMRSHTFICDQCPAIFQTRPSLHQHRLVHDQKDHHCKQCQTSFDTSYDYIMHQREHEGSEQYACTKCSYRTTKPSLIKQHLMQHEGRPVYTCNICAKKFFGKSKFDSHQELHTGIKKYACDHCSKKFLTMNYLKVHRDLNHHKEIYGYEMLHVCPECGRKFSFERSLKRHLSAIHKIGQDRTVSCPVCLKRIANNYNLKVHMRMHTGETTNMCDSCGKVYHSYKSYKKHVLKHHFEQTPGLKNETKAFSQENNDS